MAYPKDSLYCELLYNSLQSKNVTVQGGEIGFKWLYNKRKEFDIAHFHWPEFYYNTSIQTGKKFFSILRFSIFLIFLKICGLKLCWTAHNLYPHTVFKKNILDYIARNIIVLLSDAVFIHGKQSAEILSKEFRFSKIKLCEVQHGNYIDHYQNTVDRKTARERIKIPEKYYTYVFLGKCSTYKNLELLIDTFLKIKQNDVALVIAGKYSDEIYYKEISELLKSRRAEKNASRIYMFNKYISDEEMQYFANAADVIVLPYREILTSGAALLALSFGIPVIAPGKGYLKDIIRDERYGLLYKDDLQDDLGAKMAAIRSRKYDRAEILSYAKSYDWTSIAEMYHIRMAKLLGQGKGE